MTKAGASGQERLAWPDYMKGIAIFLVALGHSTLVDEGVKYWIYSFHMPVFFFVSGYFLHLKGDSLKKTVLGKAATYLPLYFVCSLLGVVAESVLAGAIKWNRMIGVFFCQQGGAYDGYLWFFLGLFGLQCVLAAILKIRKNSAFLFGVCLFLAAFALLWRELGLPRWFWHLDSGFLLAPFAGLGYLVRQEGQSMGMLVKKPAAVWAGIALLLTANLGLCWLNGIDGSKHIDYNLLLTNGIFSCYGAGIAGVLCLYLLCTRLGRWRWLSFVGENSAVYYCMNWIGSRLASPILPKLPMLLLAMAALWAVPIPAVWFLKRHLPWLIGQGGFPKPGFLKAQNKNKLSMSPKKESNRS